MGSFEQYIKGYIEINKDNVTKDLHKSDTKSIDKDKEINYINNTKKSLTTNKKVNTMKKNNNTLTNADIYNNFVQLTDKVNELLDRIAVLESRSAKPVIKPLKGAAEEVKKDIKKVAKKVEPKKNKRNPEIVKLQKKAKEMKEKMTKNQLATYNKLWGKKWQFVNKSIDLNKKEERSMAFAKGRIECARKAMTLDF